MPKTKKPPNGPGKNRAVVSTTVDLETSAEIDRLAAAGGLTRSQWAREALTEAAQENSVYSITKNTLVTKSVQNFEKTPSNICQNPWTSIIIGSENFDDGPSKAIPRNSRQAG